MTANLGNGGERNGNRWRIAAWSAAGLVLLTPLVAMQFTDEVVWTVSDFVFAGGLIGGVGLALELVIRRSGDMVYRIAVGVALAAAFLLVWINAAVGIIGGEGRDASRLYVAVPAVALLGAFVARFRPIGMAWAMVAAALAQVLVPVIASTVGGTPPEIVWVPKVLAATGGFAAMWLLSAGLFRKAAG